MVSVAFASVILLGTGLLMLPIATVGPPADFVTALFTATSATCVTGLSTVETATYWTTFGHVVIISLIQLGGLGIMTFATLVGIALSRRIGLQARMMAAAESRTVSFDDARSVLIAIVRLVAAIEGSIAVLLWFGFAVVEGRDPLHAIPEAVFHAVSAFNNAGFSVFEGNLLGYGDSPAVLLPIALAIILGGLGFPVIFEVLRRGAHWTQWTLTTKLVLLGTPVLLVAGTVVILLVEWGNPNAVGDLDPAGRVLAAFFQSVQTRTAGFNSVDIGALSPVTWLFMDLLMFIGGGPAGTAGGIRITVLLVSAALLVAVIRGNSEVRLLGKRIPADLARRAAGIAMLAFAACFAAVAAIMSMTGLDLDRIVFEVVSAFGTVGLSTGITGQLPAPALLVLVALMYVGRLGPLTIAAAFVHPTRPLPYDLPQERPIIA